MVSILSFKLWIRVAFMVVNSTFLILLLTLLPKMMLNAQSTRLLLEIILMFNICLFFYLFKSTLKVQTFLSPEHSLSYSNHRFHSIIYNNFW